MTELYNAFEVCYIDDIPCTLWPYKARPVSVLSSISDAEAYNSDVFVNDEYICLK